MLDAEFIRHLNLGVLQNFDGIITGAAIDSRRVQAGWAFFALKGEKADGHDFVQAAFKNGAALAVVTKKWAAQHQSGLPLLIVENPAETLQKLAQQWRRTFHIPVLGITGTNGKTTTRAMCAAILSTQKRTHSSSGNFNNQLGLPLTLLTMPADTEFCLLEMGTNHFGEIAALCAIAEPTGGLITNVGQGHLEFFGDQAGVARAKAELFECLPPDGVAFVNMDDNYIRQMHTPNQRFTYGFETKSVNLRGKIISIDGDGRITLRLNERWDVHLPIPGLPVAWNALAAAAVAFYYGIEPQNIIASLENFQPVDQRFVVQQIGRYRVINDTYNANPTSTLTALQTLSTIQTAGRRIFVMGDMLELGAKAEQAHTEIGQAVKDLGIDIFFGVGPLTRFATTAAQGGKVAVCHFVNQSDLIAELKKYLTPQDVVLIKGSRGSHMEEIVKGLAQ